jgi:hypothetical protein
MTENSKKAEKILIYPTIIYLSLTYASLKEVQASGEALSPQKRTSSTWKNIPVSSSQFSLGSKFFAFSPTGLIIKAVQLFFQPVSPEH